jgi:hypothetical protein
MILRVAKFLLVAAVTEDARVQPSETTSRSRRVPAKNQIMPRARYTK